MASLFPDSRHMVSERSTPSIPVSNVSRARRSADIEDLTTMIWQTMAILRPALDFVPAYPQYLVDQPLTGAVKVAPQAPDEAIAWSIIRSEPGSLSGEAFGQPRELCPRVREELIPNPYGVIDPSGGISSGIQTWGQITESIIQFDCFAESNFEAERLVTWFMGRMKDHTPTYIKYGVQKMYFWRRLRDEFIQRFRNDIISRSVQYYVRTEEVSVINVPLIKRIDIALDNIVGRPLSEVKKSETQTEIQLRLRDAL
jgi:hypothetical protein